MRRQLQANIIGNAVKRQNGIVKINQVGLVIVPKLFGAEKEFLLVGRIRQGRTLGRIPVLPIPVILPARRMILRVKVLWV